MGPHCDKSLTNISQQPCDVVSPIADISQMGKPSLRGIPLHAWCQGTVKWRNLDLNLGLLTLKLPLGFFFFFLFFLVLFYLLKLIFFSPRKLLITTINEKPISGKGKKCNESLPWPQWLKLHASIAGGMGSIPGQGTRILHALWPGQKLK